MPALLHRLKKHCPRHQFIAKCREVQEQEVHRHEAQADLLMVYSDTQVLISSSWTYHTQITVSAVISRYPPNRGHSKRYTASISIHPRNPFEWTLTVAHGLGSFCVLVPYLTAEIKGVRSGWNTSMVEQSVPNVMRWFIKNLCTRQ